MVRTLVLDEDPSVAQLVGAILQGEGTQVSVASNAQEGLEILRGEPVDVLFTEIRLRELDGLELIRQSLRINPQLATVVFTGCASFESAVGALRLGACDYITKPISRDKVLSAWTHAATFRRRSRQAEFPTPSAHIASERSTGPEDRGTAANGARTPEEEFVVASPALRELLRMAAKVAASTMPVLISGEPGVGKRHLAHYIHEKCHPTEHPFVPVPCAAMPEPHLESELFGSRSIEVGGDSLLEHACGGTLLLEDVDALPGWAQVKLFELLDPTWGPAVTAWHGQAAHSSPSRTVAGQIRVIATTTRNLETDAREGRFDRGLYDYLSAVPLRIPPLRDRPEDIQALARHFLRACRSSGHSKSPHEAVRLSPRDWETLLQYSWPGNVRELANVISRTALLGEAPQRLRNGHDDGIESQSPEEGRRVSVPLSGSFRQIECCIIRETIKHCRGNKAAAARMLGLHRRTLYRLLDNPSSE